MHIASTNVSKQYDVSIIVLVYVFGMLSLGRILISDPVADLFMHAFTFR